jgi:hypothetical protein
MFTNATVIYFYCKVNDSLRNTFGAIATSLIAQLLQADASCLAYLSEKMIASGERHPSTATLLAQILEEILSNHDPLLVCVDGLDECEPQERAKFLEVVKRVAPRADLTVKFFLTGRKEKDLENHLRSAIRLNIKPSHVEKDILSYIKLQATKLRVKFVLTAEREQAVVEIVATRPKGERAFYHSILCLM